MALLLVAVLVLTWMQFRGAFEEKTQLTVLANRSGLSMDPGSKRDLQRGAHRPAVRGGRDGRRW